MMLLPILIEQFNRTVRVMPTRMITDRIGLHSVLLHYLFTLGLYNGRSTNTLVFFYAALAEVQVAVLSLLNLPRQGFVATCRKRGTLVFAAAFICLRNTLRFANVQ